MGFIEMSRPPQVAIEQIQESTIAGFNHAVDLVARERKYLARTTGPSMEDSLAFARENIRNGNAHFLAIADGKVVGWCDIVPLKKEVFSHCGVLGMGIVDGFRGRGVGGRLIEAALRTAKENGLERVELEVFHTNAAAISLYEKVGFVEEGRKRKAARIDGAYLDLLQMALFLEDRERRRHDGTPLDRTEGTMGITEDNKRLVRRHYAEVLSGKSLRVIDEIYAETIRVGDTGSMPRGVFTSYAQMTAAAFPDLEVTVQDQIAEGDKVVSRWTARGTQRGQFLDIPPTGKTVEITAIHIHQLRDGRIVALWEQIDMLGLRKQLTDSP